MTVGSRCPNCDSVLRSTGSVGGPLAQAYDRYCPGCRPTRFFAGVGPLEPTPLVPLAERVRLGAALLDDARPGWEDEISLPGLSMMSSEEDVLGQLYGDMRRGFAQALRHRRGDVLWSAADHGFTLHNEEQDAGADPIGTILRFGELTDAWRALIEARRLVKARG